MKNYSEYKMHNDNPQQLKEAIDLVYWTLVDAIEMNPDMSTEIEDSWKVIIEKIKESE